MATYTEGWECHHCGGDGNITLDTRPSQGCPPVYGDCNRCGYTFGCGEGEGHYYLPQNFTHPNSYAYLQNLHNMNSYIYGVSMANGIEAEDIDKALYDKDEYFRIIYDAGLEALILNSVEFDSDVGNMRESRNWIMWNDYNPNTGNSWKRFAATHEAFFSDESCRLKVGDSEDWCDYCKYKGLLYQSPFMNWKRNPSEVKQ